MKKAISTLAILALLAFTLVLAKPVAAVPTLNDPYTILELTIPGGGPATIDPASCYDTASGELLMNLYDTLIFFNGEQMGDYLPQLATSWKIENITGTTSPHGLPLYYKYTFQMRTGVPYHNASYGTVSAADVEFDVERMMVTDMLGGPQWMFFEPLLNSWGCRGLGNMSDPVDQALIGHYIDDSVTQNGTHVTFYLAFPGAYQPFMQILAQQWASIYPKQWCIDLKNQGRTYMWNGTWGAGYTTWVYAFRPTVAPLDDPDPVECGSGPYKLTAIDNILLQWSAAKFDNYFRGWPADWPKMAGAQPRGWVNQTIVSWAYGTAQRIAQLNGGLCDYANIPRSSIGLVYGMPGVRCSYPMPALSVDAMYFCYDINPTSAYGPIRAAGDFDPTGVPSDFFGNPTWGLYNRQAFAQAINWDSWLLAYYLGEAQRPNSAIIPGLPQYDPSVPMYKFNTTAAKEAFKQVPGLQWNSGTNQFDNGFTITYVYNFGNTARQLLASYVQNAIQNISSTFTVNIASPDWDTFLTQCYNLQCPIFNMGWLADYPDAHNFAYAFYDTNGAYAVMAGFDYPDMQALIREGILEADPTVRKAIYHNLTTLAYERCVLVTTAQTFGRHFERNWIASWYYNPIYSGNYYYNTWKWFYYPHVVQTDATNIWDKNGFPCNHLPYDCNYDGRVNMMDVGTVAASFGAKFGPPMSTNWVFRADVDNNNSRYINMMDVGRVAQAFNPTTLYPVWHS